MSGDSTEGTEVQLSLNARWEKSDVTLMSIDNWEEEWARRHDVHLNGQVGVYGEKGDVELCPGMVSKDYFYVASKSVTIHVIKDYLMFCTC